MRWHQAYYLVDSGVERNVSFLSFLKQRLSFLDMNMYFDFFISTLFGASRGVLGVHSWFVHGLLN